MSPVWVVVLVTVGLGQMVSAIVGQDPHHHHHHGHRCGHRCKIDLCLVVDESGSVDVFDEIKVFLDKLVDTLVVGPEDIQVGLVKFNGDGELQFDLDDRPDKQDVLDGINDMDPSEGGTRISAGINTARTECFGDANGERDGVENIMLVVTDGRSTLPGDDIAAAVAAAVADDITILAVGVDNPDVPTIDFIASSIDDNIFYIEPPPVAFAGLKYTFETAVPAVNKRIRHFCHTCELDLCLVVDESGSNDVFNQVKGFLINLMWELDIGPEAIQVGLVLFSDVANVEFDLDDEDKAGVIAGIGGVVQADGLTKLSAGINRARTHCFGAAHGDRDGVPDVILMVTDGISTVMGVDDFEGAANDARDEGIEIIVVGVSEPHEPSLWKLAGGILANIFYVDDADPEAYTFTTIVPAMENRLLMLCNICELDLCVVLDESGSLAGFNNVISFLVALMDRLDIGVSAVRVGLVKFNTIGTLEFHLDDIMTKDGVKAAIGALDQDLGNTKVSAGINTATTECFNPCYGDRKSAPNLMLVVTDGISTAPGDDIIGAASDARDAGITIIGIGVENPDVPTMNIIVNNLQANLFQTDPPGDYDYTTLVPAVTNHLLSFCLICRVDVCFVVDESGSIDEFDAVKQFVKDFIHVMNVGPTGTRVGLVTFNGDGDLRFDLNDHFTKSAVFDHIDTISPGAGWTNIASGIETGRTECFGSANGDREDAQNVMYVITDGWSTIFPDDVAGAAGDARGDGIAVIGIGVRDPNMGVISLIAGGIPNHIFNADDYNSGTDADPDYTPLVPAMRANYLTFCHSLCLADVCFVVDESGSVDVWPQIKTFMINFVNTHSIGPFGTQVAVVEFNGAGNPIFDLVKYLTAGEVVTGITDDMVQSNDLTNIAAGINAGISYCFGSGHGSRSNARHVMILITDGWNGVGAPDPVPASNAAQAAGIELLAIGVDSPNMAMINALAGHPDYAFNAGDFTTLNADIAEIYDVLCHTMCRFDMCFVIDESGSIGPNHHALAIESVISFVSAIDIGYHDNLVGALQFNGDPSEMFDLDKYLTHPPMIGAIGAFPYSYGTTDIGDAIELARDFCFHDADSGNRPFAHNVMYVMTDGGAQDKDHAKDEADATWFEGTDIVVMGAKAMDYDADVLEYIAYVPENNFLATIYTVEAWNPVTTGIIKWYYKNAQYQ